MLPAKRPAAPVKADVVITGYNGVTIENAAGGLLRLAGDPTPLANICGGNALRNRGTLQKTSGTWAAVIDEYGLVLRTPAQISTTARLHRQDSPFRFGTKAAWVVGETTVAKLVLYTLDASLSLVRHEIR